ncbi:MAG: tRNA 2-selenouridine(34) synthase MnmH [Bacteroidota bacterium]
MKKLSPVDFLKCSAPCLDVRSPGEFKQGRILKAISFPLFSDQERTQVGTIYKKEGKKQAVKVGFSLVGPKIRTFIEKVEAFEEDTIKIYCWRGGMRSSGMAWLLEQVGLKVYLLQNGYKAYRNYALQAFEQSLKLKILTGFTGSGKTEILQEMSKLGAQIIDLERFANHPGSSFGNQLKRSQPTTEMFQNMLFHQLATFDLEKPIWLEDESFCIGKVHLPEALFRQMKISPRYLLKVAKDQRKQLLVKQYGAIGTNNLIAATKAIQKKLGLSKTNEAIDHIINHRAFEAADILLSYYDRQYEKNMHRSGQKILETVNFSTFCPKQMAKQILDEHGS